MPHRASVCLAGFAHVLGAILAVKSRPALDADISVMFDIYLDFVKSRIKLSLNKQLLVRAWQCMLSSVMGLKTQGKRLQLEPLPGISRT